MVTFGCTIDLSGIPSALCPLCPLSPRARDSDPSPRGRRADESPSPTTPLSMPPKTPSNRVRSRSEVRTPITPSIISGLSNVSLVVSPTKKSLQSRGGFKSTGAFDTNQFLASGNARSRSGSRPASPSKQKSQPVGVIRKGGVESRLDVVTCDYVPPPKQELKRSRSTPASVCIHKVRRTERS